MNARAILVVDDEQLIRWSLAERLREEGFDVIEAATRGARWGRKLPRGAAVDAALA